MRCLRWHRRLKACARLLRLPTIEDIAEQRAELEYVRAQERFRFSELDPELRPPKQCYFNTGCCIFGDGDVTGIEISEGEIKLVKWSNARDGYQLEVKAKADLQDIFTKL